MPLLVFCIEIYLGSLGHKISYLFWLSRHLGLKLFAVMKAEQSPENRF